MKPGKYDPPNKQEILKKYPEIRTLGEVITGRPFNMALPQKAKDGEGASRVSEETSPQESKKRGRKTIVTPERIRIVCEVLKSGGTEGAACLKAGIGSTAWNAAKKRFHELCGQIRQAKLEWADLRYKRHMNARYESQSMRAARRKALKPKPTKQAGLVMWHLITRIPLNVAGFTREQEQQACEEFNYCLDQWNRQKAAFGLMQKIYKKRAELRGQNPQAPVQSMKHFIAQQTNPNPTYGVP